MSRRRILPVFVPHAGCRHTCVYCNQLSTSQSVEMPGPESIAHLVGEAVRYGSLDEVAFYGGSFTALPSDIQAALFAPVQTFIKAGKVGGIRLSTRPDALDEQIVQDLKAHGVSTVELGCQSFSDPVLKASGRGHVAADAVEAATILKQQGFSLGIQLMPGLPGADRGEAISSLAVALALSPDFLRVYPTIVLESTRLAGLWRRGHFKPFDLETAVEVCADIELTCRSRGVPVIRYGLQANEDLNGGAVLAGPYHPAFGQLVKSRIWRRALMVLQGTGRQAVRVHPADLSDAFGHQKSNLEFLESSPGQRVVIGTDASLSRGTISAGNLVSAVAGVLSAH